MKFEDKRGGIRRVEESESRFQREGDRMLGFGSRCGDGSVREMFENREKQRSDERDFRGCLVCDSEFVFCFLILNSRKHF